MDGGDRAGYKQVSLTVKATIITSTMATAVRTSTHPGGWGHVEVMSSGAVYALVQASGITGSSLITSATTYPMGSVIAGGQTTGIKLSSKTTGHKVIAYERVLL